MINFFVIILGNLIIFLIKLLHLGSGSTWPGHIALGLNKDFIREIITNNPKLKVILIAGTNGKTTTGKITQSILEKSGKKVFLNASGANLLNGIASSLVLNTNLFGIIKNNFAIFEIDENTLPLVLKEIPSPNYVLLLNLFRDQLDRYGEVNIIANKWNLAIKQLSGKTTLILNADDPQITHLASHLKCVSVKFFGVKANNFEGIQHASDSIYCPSCGKKLIYKSIVFSHLGDWKCPKCGFKRPEEVNTLSKIYPLLGIYNQYNTNASVLLAREIGIDDKVIDSALQNFKPAFGRQEILEYKGKKVQIFLSKNPTGFNESLRTITDLHAKNLLIVLNDRIPDGHDVSWIWDVDFEKFNIKFKSVVVSGDRANDMALRLKYAGFNHDDTFEDLEKAISYALDKTPKDRILYILPTYSAMLETRKILTGKKIL